MLAAARNKMGLSEGQVEYCLEAWSLICGSMRIELDVSTARASGSRTRFSETDECVYLGADSYPGDGSTANPRMSTLACLAHELAHSVRFHRGYRRPLDLPDVLVDEAETSLHASFEAVLNARDREDLVEDARDRLIHWLSLRHDRGTNDEG